MNAQLQAVALDRTDMTPSLEPMAIAPSTALTPTQMAYQLIAGGASLEAVEKMLDMTDRLSKDQARRAFDAAVAAAKAEIKPVRKNRKGHSGEYADLAAYAAGIDAVLGRHGLSYRHSVPQQTEKTVTVVCKIAHKDGHVESTELTAGFDTSGSKNSIQSLGSTLTYLQRYSLVLALGLSATATDDDGAAAGGDTLTEDQVEEIKALIDQAVAARPGTNHAEWIETFLDFMKVPALNAIRAKDFAKAKSTIQNAIKQGAK